jgi:hypothetical protein
LRGALSAAAGSSEVIMRQTRIAAPVVAAAMLWVSFPVLPAHAQATQAQPAAPEQPTWFAVPQPPGQKVEVLTIDGNWHKARLRLVTGDAIILGSDRPPIRREQVWQVWAGGKPSWGWRGFWIGLGVGLAAGLAAYHDQGDCADPTSVCAREGEFGPGAVVFGGLVFGAGGAILGRLIGGPSRPPALVYAGPTVLNPPARAPGRRP